MEEALTARLLASVAITGIFGTRLHWQTRPNTDAPSLTMTVAADPVDYNHDGADGWQQVRVQFDSRASSYLSAKQGLRAVTAVLEETGDVEGVHFDEGRKVSGSDAPKETLAGGSEVFRVTMDMMIPFRAV